MEVLIEEASSNIISKKKQALETLLNEIRKNRGTLPISNFSRFFSIVKERLQESDLDLLSITLQICQEIIPNFGPDLESNFNSLLPIFIILTGDLRSGVGKTSTSILSLYIKTTRNLESVMLALIKYGLCHEDWKIRHKALMNIIPFINLDLSYTLNVQEMKKILERVIGLIKDSSAQVAESAKDVASGIKELCCDFNSVFGRLSLAYQQIFQEYCETIRGSAVLRGSFQRISEGTSKSILEGLEKPKAFVFQSSSLVGVASNISPAYLESSKNNLVFGFIPAELMQQLEDQENWRMRVSAVQELENLVVSLDSFTHVMPYMAILLRFLNKLLEDTNFKVSISALNIVKEIICIPGVSQQSNITQILPQCIKKLGDNKISVRQSTFKVLVCLIKNSKPRVISSVIMPSLCEALSSQNWHIREEVVIVLLASMLEEVDFDFLTIIPDLAKLLDDAKTKIRYVTTEAFAVLSHKHSATLLQILKPIVDETAIKALSTRFDFKALPILTEDYVEFPKTFPSSAPSISSPYITANTFTSPFIKTLESNEISKNNHESITPSTINSSMSPLINVKVKRLRPASETNFPIEDSSVKAPKKAFIMKNEKNERNSKMSYHGRFILKQTQEKGINEVANKTMIEGNSRTYQSSPVLSKPKPGESGVEEQPVYLSVEELKKVSNPEDALQKCIVAGSLENWIDQFEALNMLRRLLKHHQEVFLSQVTLHNICLDLIKWADSLRSSLSKNALIVIGEMCENLGRSIDSEITELLKVLIKKAIDTNLFISDQANVALESMCKYSNENKILNTLISLSNTSKNALSKAILAKSFSKIFKRLMYNISKCKDLDKILTILADYLSDASFDVRNNSKEAVIALSKGFPSDMDLERVLLRALPDASRKKIMEAIHSKTGDMRTLSPIKKSAHRDLRSSQMIEKYSRNLRTRSIGASQEAPELEGIQKIQGDMSSNEWKIRYNSIGTLQDLVIENAQILKSSQKLLTAIDIFCKGLSDSNLKVHIHTLNALKKVIPVLSKSLEPHLILLISSLLPGLGSANSSIREIAKEVANIIIQNCDPGAVIIPSTSAIHNANTRSRATLVALIIELIPKVYEKRPNVIIKNVIPAMIKLMDDTKIEIREECGKLFFKVYEVMSSEFFEHVPAGKMQKVLDIVNEGM
ncbi:hypothetical protein SteCoe_14497 [Stentor coeruleus]|uniref:TOG domain-containing protein n=1 Tax=Stentor coeruleus TaxID=5963 RepID=A0A1R2C613_9CILI|nr:hypothetical protein SteCoe_14497 [Stentor coeruleus]